MIVIVHDVVLVVPSRVDAQDLSVTWPFILFVCLFMLILSIHLLCYQNTKLPLSD